MSPVAAIESYTSISFPRVSGDEPPTFGARIAATAFPRVSGDEPGYDARLYVLVEFSPRERG